MITGGLLLLLLLPSARCTARVRLWGVPSSAPTAQLHHELAATATAALAELSESATEPPEGSQSARGPSPVPPPPEAGGASALLLLSREALACRSRSKHDSVPPTEGSSGKLVALVACSTGSMPS